MNQIQHGIFMHNGVILTQQQYFMMVHNYVSERNMDIDISHRIYRIIHNIPGFIPIIPFIRDANNTTLEANRDANRDAKRFQTDANQKNRFVATAPQRTRGLNRSQIEG
jgi:hypothetical protein